MKFFPSTSASTRRMALSAVFTSLLIAGCGGGGGSNNSIKPTKAMYDQITLDMPYSQVVAIVGSDGRELGWGPNDPTTRARWVKGDSSLSTCISQGSLVIGKAYTGPETGGKTIGQLAPGLSGC